MSIIKRFRKYGWAVLGVFLVAATVTPQSPFVTYLPIVQGQGGGTVSNPGGPATATIAPSPTSTLVPPTSVPSATPTKYTNGYADDDSDQHDDADPHADAYQDTQADQNPRPYPFGIGRDPPGGRGYRALRCVWQRADGEDHQPIPQCGGCAAGR